MTIRYDGLPNEMDYYLKAKTPVFLACEEWDDNRFAYPAVCITEPVEDLDGNYIGRTYEAFYPSSEYLDEEGWEALQHGAAYYVEGMSYTEAEDRETRVDCFRAAELLYLHATAKGNAIAWLNLGYVYSYDRCEGNYFRDLRHAETEEDYDAPFPREQRAFECYKRAADAGLAEGLYKLGDMYKQGVGCEPSAQEAFACYMRAAEECSNSYAVTSGSIALRLGNAYENASGCEQSFAKALKWYERAAADLEIAVRSGEWFYKKALSSAKDGVTRCKQERLDQ